MVACWKTHLFSFQKAFGKQGYCTGLNPWGSWKNGQEWRKNRRHPAYWSKWEVRRDDCGDSRLARVKEWASVINLKIKNRFFLSHLYLLEKQIPSNTTKTFSCKIWCFSYQNTMVGFFSDLPWLGFGFCPPPLPPLPPRNNNKSWFLKPLCSDFPLQVTGHVV